MGQPLKIIVLEGDETGQELLEQALRVLASETIRVELSSLSAELGRVTKPTCVLSAALMVVSGIVSVMLSSASAALSTVTTSDPSSPGRTTRAAGTPSRSSSGSPPR